MKKLLIFQIALFINLLALSQEDFIIHTDNIEAQVEKNPDIFCRVVNRQLELNTNNNYSNLILACIKIISNKPNESIKILDSLHIIKYRISEVYYIKGLAEMLLQDLHSAIKYFKESLINDPFNGNTYMFKALCKLEKDDLLGAISDLNTASRLLRIDRKFYIPEKIKTCISINQKLLKNELLTIISQESILPNLLQSYFVNFITKRPALKEDEDIKDDILYSNNDIANYSKRHLTHFFNEYTPPNSFINEKEGLNILRNITYDLNEETVIHIKIDAGCLIKLLASDNQKNNIYLINALQETGNYIDNGIDNYLKKIIQAFNRKNVAKNVASIFWEHSSHYLNENSSNEDVLDYLKKELEALFSITERRIAINLDKLPNILKMSFDKTTATVRVSVFDYNCFDNILNYLSTPGKLDVKSNNQGLNFFFKDFGFHIIASHLKYDYKQRKLFFVTEFDKVGQSYIRRFSTDKIKDQVNPVYLDNTNIGQFTFSKIEKEGLITHLNFYEANITKAKINADFNPGLLGYPKISIKNENATNSLKSPLIKEPLVILGDKEMREQILKIDSLINKQPNNSESYFIRGLLKADLTMFESAKLDFETAIKLNPNKKEYAYYLGVTFFNLMQYQDSKKIFTSALALDSKYLDAIYLRGISSILIGEKKEGCVDLDNFKTLSGKKQLKNNFCN